MPSSTISTPLYSIATSIPFHATSSPSCPQRVFLSTLPSFLIDDHNIAVAPESHVPSASPRTSKPRPRARREGELRSMCHPQAPKSKFS
ncbi:hypothetical protein NMY22_g11492 [Coprinellus aureogranulatus]|nr:hypothetical protein NMY22_g11492 [Coprinellus aureogranulatus]